MAKKFDFLSPGIEIREIDQSFLPQEADALGPIIIGRTRKGPANKPVKVRNLDDFVSVFGAPVPGGNGPQGDVWRDGNTIGPTYASYAAQAWLASEESPVTIVRLAGEEKVGASSFGKAGWELPKSPAAAAADNATAYGLFLCASGATDFGTGSLAAVFYANSGYLTLDGTKASTSIPSTKEAGTFIKSVGTNCEFTLQAYTAGAVASDNLTFNFSRNSSKYIRSVFNTNPQLVNTTTVATAQRKTYWLGESFAREVSTLTSAAAGDVYGMLLPLESGSVNWSDHREGSKEAYSGYVVSQQEKTQQDMFRFKSLHVGQEIEKNYMIAIEDILEPPNPTVNAFGTFTVAIKNIAGQTIERYTGCNLNPSSPDYLSKRIGDQYQEWSDTDRRYRTYGDFQNQSDIIYVDMKQFIKDGGGQGLLPAGFKGPVRPKGFTLAYGSKGANAFGDDDNDGVKATATLQINSSAKIKTGDGAILSNGAVTANGGVFVTSLVASDLDSDSFSIVFANDATNKTTDRSGAVLKGRTIEVVFQNMSNVAGTSPGADQIFIAAQAGGTGNYASKAQVAQMIVNALTAKQDDSLITASGRSFSQAIKYGTNAANIAVGTNGGDLGSVFEATVVNTDGVKIQLRGSQTSVGANLGAYGGAWASATSIAKITIAQTTLGTTAGGATQTFTAGNATGATTVTLQSLIGTETAKTANADFFVDGHQTAGTANNSTATNLEVALEAVSGFEATVSTDTVTAEVITPGNSGNDAKIKFANAEAGAFTNQGVADDDDQNFTGGSDTDDFDGAFVKGNDSVPATGGSTTAFVDGPFNFTASFKFPSIPLRANGTEGGAPDPYRAYYGIRPAIDTSSTQHDPDYCDYLRRLAVGADSFTPGDDFELSFTFTLDDLVIDTAANTVTYTDASYTAGTSYTKLNTFGALLDKNVRQFLMPIHGGAEGWDITEKEPLRDDLIGTTRDDATNYLQYTMNKALDSVLDPEVVPANLILMPGIRKPLITDRIISTAESRKDVLAIIDLENDYKPSAERRTQDTDSNSLGDVVSAVSSIKARNLNSSYASTFYPWVQISDNLNNKELVWIPPSVAALGAFGKSQAQSELWFAPAGFNRGGLGNLGGTRGPLVLQARQRLDSKERDSLYEVNVNPIATFPAEGVVIFGQKTLQADQSALDRINVRRLVLYLKAEVSDISRKLLFDNNLETTWNRFKGQVEPVLSSTKARFGLADYKVILDETTTTADLIDRNIMYAKIYIKPARAIEYIVVDFVITKTGADFV